MRTVNIGEKLGGPLNIGGMESTYSASSIADGAREMLDSYSHRVTRFLVIDYKIDDEGRMQFHIFPRVPDVDGFPPDEQSFVAAVEKAFINIIGRGADVEAELHEIDGRQVVTAEVDGKPVDIEQKADTRVWAYHRNQDGSLTHVKYHKPVPMLWVCVHRVPGLMAPPGDTQNLLVEALVAATENLVPKS